MGFSVQYTENGGIEATQSFVARKSDLAPDNFNLSIFFRGATWESVFPQVPEIYRGLTMKTFDPDESQPGIVIIKCIFTGYQYSAGGSSGEEQIVPTTSLRGSLEQLPLSQNQAWIDLTPTEKIFLGKLIRGELALNGDGTSPGVWDDKHEFFTNAKDGAGNFVSFAGDALIFATMIGEGRTTYDGPSWVYNYRTESKTGFTGAQLAALGKISATPPGNPEKPPTGWTWQLAGPDQDQSGPDRYIRNLTYRLIRNNAENQMLYKP